MIAGCPRRGRRNAGPFATIAVSQWIIHRSILCSAALTATIAMAQRPVTMRRTGDAFQDAWRAASQAGDVDAMQTLSEWDPPSQTSSVDEVAQQAIRQSQLSTWKAAESLGLATSTRWEAKSLSPDTEPIDRLLENSPQHPRYLFLEAARLDLRRIAIFQTLSVLGVPPGRTGRDRIAEVIAALEEDRTRLIEQLANHRDSDHRTLWQRQTAETVADAMIEIELHPPLSEDRLATAASAFRRAESAAAALPATSAAAAEIRLLGWIAAIEAHQWEEAAKLEPAADANLRDARVQTMRLRRELYRNDLRAAESQMRGVDWTRVPQSLMLERLRYLSMLPTAKRTGVVDDWLDEIQRVHGPAARRRGVRLLATAGHAGSDEAMLRSVASAAIVRGDDREAAATLAVLANQTDDPEKGFQAAVQAAALLKTVDTAAASEVLRNFSQRFSSHRSAADMHFQSLLIDPPEAPDRRIQTFRDHVRRFPNSPQIEAVRRWWSRTEVELGNEIVAVFELPESDLGPSIEAAWAEAASVAVEDSSAWSTKWSETFDGWADSAKPDQVRSVASSLLRILDLDTKLPARLHQFVDEVADSDALVQFRWVEPDSSQTTPQLTAIASERLIMDAIERDDRRPATVDRLQSADAPGGSLVQAAVALWNGQTEMALRTLETMIAEDPTRLMSAARLAGTGPSDARRRAVIWLGHLAAGLPTASQAWHRAKVQQLSLQSIDEPAAAAGQAAAILLVHPKTSPSFERQYQAVVAIADAPVE